MVIPNSFPLFFPSKVVVALIGYGLKGNKVSGDLCVCFSIFVFWLQFPMSLPNLARVRCASAGNWAGIGPVTKNKQREMEKYMCKSRERTTKRCVPEEF